MFQPDRKQKMISIRLSATEYQFLKTQHENFGVRNVSDLARLAVQRIMDGSPVAQQTIAGKLADLDNRIRALEAQVSEILQRGWAGASSSGGS